MNVRICKGVGSGATELAAFDHALVEAGVANFNLIYLSSVLPPNSKVVDVGKLKDPPGTWGDRLYLVIAQKRTIQRNQEVWAGIGWIQDPKTKAGLLVEHEGHNEQEVRADISNSLTGLIKNRGNKNQFGPIHMEVVGTRCVDQPVCALVVAVFENQDWQTAADSTENPVNRLRRFARVLDKKRN